MCRNFWKILYINYIKLIRGVLICRNAALWLHFSILQMTKMYCITKCSQTTLLWHVLFIHTTYWIDSNNWICCVNIEGGLSLSLSLTSPLFLSLSLSCPLCHKETLKTIFVTNDDFLCVLGWWKLPRSTTRWVTFPSAKRRDSWSASLRNSHPRNIVSTERICSYCSSVLPFCT